METLTRFSSRHILEQRCRACSCKCWIVDRAIQVNDLDILAQACFDGGKKRLVCSRVREFLSGCADYANRAQGKQYCDWSGTQVDFLRQDPAQLTTLIGRCPHQRDLRIVWIKASAFEL